MARLPLAFVEGGGVTARGGVDVRGSGANGAGSDLVAVASGPGARQPTARLGPLDQGELRSGTTRSHTLSTRRAEAVPDRDDGARWRRRVQLLRRGWGPRDAVRLRRPAPRAVGTHGGPGRTDDWQRQRRARARFDRWAGLGDQCFPRARRRRAGGG